MNLERRSFIKGSALLAAMSAVGGVRAAGIVNHEQKYHDRWHATQLPVPQKLLDSEPVLQCPAPDSMGVAFAVSDFALGYAEVADNEKMENAVQYACEGVPLAMLDDRVMRIRMTGLKPGTKYWYRVGASTLAFPVGYWKKPSPPEWSKVYSFTTCGENASSHFSVITDTHTNWKTFALLAQKLRAIGAPVTLWLGDASSHTETREELIKVFLKTETGGDYATTRPVFFINGNHDFRGRACLHSTEVMMGRLPSERSGRDWPLVRNFAVRQGEIALIGLDTGEDKPDFHPSAGGATRFEPYRTMQTAWLADQFKRPEIVRAPYIVAFMHIPIFDSRPDANPGNTLENYAAWQKQGHDEWGPLLKQYGAQLVVAGHCHCYRYDEPTAERPWAQIVGGGPHMVADKFPTVIEGEVEDGELKVRVHNMFTGKVEATHVFKSRKP